MTLQELKSIFSDYEQEPLNDPLLEGGFILQKYDSNVLHCVYDEGVLGPLIEDVLEAGITHEDAIALARMGWTLNNCGRFYCFV